MQPTTLNQDEFRMLIKGLVSLGAMPTDESLDNIYQMIYQAGLAQYYAQSDQEIEGLIQVSAHNSKLPLKLTDAARELGAAVPETELEITLRRLFT